MIAAVPLDGARPSPCTRTLMSGATSDLVSHTAGVAFRAFRDTVVDDGTFDTSDHEASEPLHHPEGT